MSKMLMMEVKFTKGSSIHNVKADDKEKATLNLTRLLEEFNVFSRRSTHLTYMPINLLRLTFLCLCKVSNQSTCRSSLGLKVHKYLHREQSMLVDIASFKLNKDNIKPNISSGSILIRSP